MLATFLKPLHPLVDGLLFWRELPGLPILRYGDVSDAPTWRPDDSVSPEAFERQMHWLSRKGYTAYTLEDLRMRKMVKRAVAITFDGGTRDTYRNALPILTRYHFEATVFVAADVVADNWCGGEGEHRQCIAMMDERQLQELKTAGWTIANYFAEGKAFLHENRFQIEQSFQRAQDRLHGLAGIEAAAGAVAYPGGVVTAEVLAAAHAQQVRLGFALGDRLYRLTDAKFLIPRFRITRDLPFAQFKRIFSPTFQSWCVDNRKTQLERLAEEIQTAKDNT